MDGLDLFQRLPFCGCGGCQPEEYVFEYLLHLFADELIRLQEPVRPFAWYLKHPSSTSQWLKAHGDLGEIIAHIADHAKLTQHGGSVLAAWLTEDGRRAIAIWMERGTDDYAWREVTQ